MTHAHVICMNDSVEHVHIGTEAEASSHLVELRWKHFNLNFYIYRPLGSGPFDPLDYFRNYQTRVRWHIRTVPLTQGESS